MKRQLLYSFVALLSIAATSNIFAAGLWDSYVYINGTAAGNTYFLGGSNNSSATAFNNANLGSFTAGTGVVTLTGGQANTWRTPGSQNICSGTLYYRVYPTGSPSGSFTSFNLPYDNVYGNQGNNQQWASTSGTANLAFGLAPGNYTVEMYAQATGDDNSSSGCGMNYFQSNGGANFTATFSVTCPTGALAAGTYTVGAGQCFPTIQSAATYINTNGIAGAVVFNVLAGHTETAAAGGIQFNAITGTSITNTITFQKSGSGANPKVTAAAAQTAGFVLDGCIRLVGTDYITFDAIDVAEGAGTTTAIATNNMTEAGYAILNASTTDGCQNVTIKNCVITMNKTYQNSFGIFSNNSILGTNGTSQTTGATALSVNLHNNLKIYGNTISNVAMGIIILMPPTTSTLSMTGLDIGGSSAATGNSITNFGNNTANFSYTNLTTTTNAAILIRNATGYNCSYNTINDAGFSTTVAHYGILGSHGTAPAGVTFTSTANNNTVTVIQTGTTAVAGIDMANGGALSGASYTANNNTVSVTQTSTVTSSGTVTGIALNYGGALSSLNASNNTVTITQNNNGAVAFSGTVNGINMNTASTNMTASSNTITIAQNISSTGTYSSTTNGINAASVITGTGTFASNQIRQWIIRSTGTVSMLNINASHTGTVTVNGNSTTGTTTPYFTRGGTTTGGTYYGYNSNGSASSGTTNVYNNNFSEIAISGTATFTGIFEQNGGIGQTKSVYNNTVSNISGGTTGTITSIQAGFASTLNLYSNTITNISGGGTVIGMNIVGSCPTANVYSNNVNTLSSTGTASIVTGITGNSATSGGNLSIYKNRVYSLANNAAGSVQCIGIAFTGGALSSIYNNFVSGFSTTASTNVQAMIGINCNSGTNANVNYNTVRLGGTGGTGFGATGVQFSSTYTAFNHKNNIYNIDCTPSGTGLVAAVRRSGVQLGIVAPTTAIFASDNNIYYVPSGQFSFIYAEGTNNTTAGTSYKNCYGLGSTADDATNNIKYDANAATFNGSCSKYKAWMGSGHEQSVFVENNLVAGGTTGTFAPSGTSFAESAATLTTTPSITVDFADVARGSTPDIGALEFNGTATDASAPTITYTVVPSSACSPILTATITDASGVNTTAGTKPRLWYKRTADATTGVASANDNTTTGWKFVEASNASSPFTFAFDYSKLDATPANAETISYFVVAQDNASTPNVGNNTVTFGGGCPTTVALAGLTMTGGNTYTVQSLPTSVATSATTPTLCFSGSTALSLTPTGGVLGGLTYEWYNTAAPATVLGTSSTYTTTLTSSASFAARMYCNGAEITANGSPSTPVTVTVNSPNVGTVNNGTRCGTGTVDLSVTGNNGTVSWYAAATGGSALGTGTTFTTPSIAATTTYYVSALTPLLNSTIAVGTGASTSLSAGVSPYNGGWGGIKSQYIILASELTNAGIIAGNINSVSFEVTSLGATTLNGFAVSIGTTSQTVATSTAVTGLTQVYYNATQTITSGVNTYTFSTPFNWDGTSNIVVQTCWSNNNTSNSSSTVKSDAAGFTSSTFIQGDNATAADVCAAITTTNPVSLGSNRTSGTSSSRPRMIFNAVGKCETSRTAVTATVTTPPSITASATVTRCANDAANTLSVSSSNDPNYTYTWSTGDTGASTNVSPTVTTTYTVTAADTSGGANNGCNTTSSVLVNVNANPSPMTVTPASPSVCNGSSVNLVATGGTIGNSGNATIGTATTLTGVTSQPTAFCNRWTQYWCQTVFTAAELQAQGMIAGNINSITYNITTLGDGTNVTNFSVHIGNTANSTLSGFTTTGLTQVYGPATYNHTIGANTITFTTPYPWDGVSNIILDIRQNGADATNNAQTFFTATTGNTVVHATTSSASPALWTSNPSATTSTSRLNTIFGWSSSIPTTLAWSPNTGLNTTNGATVTAAPTATTTYSVVSTSAAGCTSSNTATVTVNPLPTIDAGADATVNCANPSATLTATGGNSYVWSTGATTASISVSPTVTTTYSVTGTDANGCVNTDNVTIDIDFATPTANAGMDVTVNCNAPSTILTATGSGTYAWDNGATQGGTVSPTTTTTYTVTVTGANGCTAIDDVVVTADFAAPTANAGMDVTVNCNSPSTTLTATGSGTYAWDNGATQGGTVSPTTTTTYTVTVTGANGCTATDDVIVTADFAAPTANAGMDVTVNCNTPSTILTASGGVSYVWDNGVTQGGSVSPTSTTTYTVTVTAANGCTATDEVVVTADKTAPSADAGMDVTVTCANPSTILSATGNGTYTWNNGATQGGSVSPAMTTTYTVTVTAANGCTTTDDIQVTADFAAPTANAGMDVTVNCTTPSTTLTASGGVSYAWDNGATQGGTVSPTTTTTYTVTVTGANGCTATDDVVVTADFAAPTADAGMDVTVNCTTPSTTLTASGGVSYVWNNGGTQGGTVSPTSTTTYTVTVTGANGCTATDEVVVTADKTAPSADAGMDVTVTCANPSTILSATGNGTYTWNNGATQGGSVSPAMTTTYTVTVTAANGCTTTDDVVVTADKGAPSINAGADVTVNCTTPSTVLTAMGGVSYVWNNGATQGGTVSPTMTTTYTVTVTAANGCTATDNVIVTADFVAPTADAGADIALTTLNPNGTLTASGGVAYLWNNGETTATISVSVTSDTNYSVTVTAANGCTDVDDVTVFYTNSDVTPPTFTFVPANVTLNCQDAGNIPSVDDALDLVTVMDDYPGVSVTNDRVSTQDTSSISCSHYNYTVTTTWTATDASGNTSTAVQVITVRDNSAPTLAAAPANVSISQNVIPYTSLSTPTAMDNCSTPVVTVADTDDKNTVVKPACVSVFYNITRTWTATDVCGNTSTTAQVIHVEDQVLLSCPSSKKLLSNATGCSRQIVAADLVSPTFSDVCDLSYLSHSIMGATTKSGSGSIAGSILNVGVNTITYTANFSASVTCSFDITIEDKTPPTVNVTQPVIVVNACSFTDPAAVAAINAAKPTPTDNCALAASPLSESSSDVNLASSCKTKPVATKYLSSRTFTYTVTDAAGNTASATQVIYLRDNTAPTASCNNDVTITIGNTNVTIPASTFNSTTSPSSDNCTAPSALAYSACLNTTTTACTNFATNLTFTKAMLGTANSVTRTIIFRVTDACGNNSTCQATVTLKKSGTMANNNNSDLLPELASDNTNNKPNEISQTVTAHGDMKCFPNPFAEDLNIQYNLTEDVDVVVLKVYDNQGRLVSKMDQGESLAGFYSVRWNLAKLDAGMYHICLEMDGKCTNIQRVLMVK